MIFKEITYLIIIKVNNFSPTDREAGSTRNKGLIEQKMDERPFKKI